jgi:hypothetical protein
MPICDVCSQPVGYSEGYALTTLEVAGNENYWYQMLSMISDDDLLMMTVQQQAMQRSGWLAGL